MLDNISRVGSTISPDGQLVILSKQDVLTPPYPQPKIWFESWQAGGDRNFLQVPAQAQPTAGAISPDRRTAAIGDRLGTVSFINLTVAPCVMGDPVGVGPSPGINPRTIGILKFMPDGRGVLAVDGNGSCFIVTPTPKPEMRLLRAGESPVQSAGFSHDSRFALIGDRAGDVEIWEIATGKRIRGFHADGAVWAVQLSPDDRVLYAATLDGRIHAWAVDLAEESVVCHCAGIPQSVAISADKLLAAAASGPEVEVFDVATHHALGHYKVVGNVTSLIFSRAGWTLTAATDRGEITRTVFGAATESAGNAPAGLFATSVLIEPDTREKMPQGVYLSSASDSAIELTSYTAERIDLSTKTRVGFDKDVLSTVGCISSDGSKAISVLDHMAPSNVIYVYDYGGKTARKIEIPTPKFFTAAALSADGTTAFLAINGMIRAIDTADGRVKWEKQSYQNVIRALSLSPAGGTLLSGADDGTLRSWDATDGDPERVVTDGLNPVTSIAFSAAGDFILSNGGSGNGLCAWDLSLPIREQAAQKPLETARWRVSAGAASAADVATVVEWYRVQGMPKWGRLLLDEAHMDEQFGIIAARCRWEANDGARAADDFRALIGRSDTHLPDWYLRACAAEACTAQK
jgi:WD40 repeat protein